MKARSMLLCVVLVVLAACGGAAEWSEFAPDGGGFTVSMPGVPEESRQAIDTAVGSIETVTYLLDSNPIGYFVSYFDLPDIALQDGAGAMIASGRDGAIANLEDGTLISENDLTVDGFPANEFVASFTLNGEAGGGSAKGRYILANNRLYQVFILAEKGSADSPDIDKFLTSFGLAK